MHESKKLYYFYLIEKVLRQRLFDKTDTLEEYNMKVDYLREKLSLKC